MNAMLCLKMVDTKSKKEIDQIIEQIAKEGRNQGVHLIFATQTLTGCTIPRSIINQITDPYLLKCSPVDAQLFVENPTKILNLLTLHCAYHKDHASNQDEYFCPIFLGKEKMDNCLKALNQKVQVCNWISALSILQEHKAINSRKDWKISLTRGMQRLHLGEVWKCSLKT